MSIFLKTLGRLRVNYSCFRLIRLIYPTFWKHWLNEIRYYQCCERFLRRVIFYRFKIFFFWNNFNLKKIKLLSMRHCPRRGWENFRYFHFWIRAESKQVAIKKTHLILMKRLIIISKITCELKIALETVGGNRLKSDANFVDQEL